MVAATARKTPLCFEAGSGSSSSPTAFPAGLPAGAAISPLALELHARATRPEPVRDTAESRCRGCCRRFAGTCFTGNCSTPITRSAQASISLIRPDSRCSREPSGPDVLGRCLDSIVQGPDSESRQTRSYAPGRACGSASTNSQRTPPFASISAPTMPVPLYRTCPIRRICPGYRSDTWTRRSRVPRGRSPNHR